MKKVYRPILLVFIMTMSTLVFIACNKNNNNPNPNIVLDEKIYAE